jgi:hypothetical protein
MRKERAEKWRTVNDELRFDAVSFPTRFKAVCKLKTAFKLGSTSYPLFVPNRLQVR